MKNNKNKKKFFFDFEYKFCFISVKNYVNKDINIKKYIIEIKYIRI